MSKTEIYLERDEILSALKFSDSERCYFKLALNYKFNDIETDKLSEDRIQQKKDSITEYYILDMLENSAFLKGSSHQLTNKKRNILLWNAKRILSNREVVENFQTKMAKENEILTYRTCLDWLSVMN